MDAEREVNQLLKESGAVLLRDSKHEVWRLPNGRKFTRAKTMSDAYRGSLNSLAELRKALGVENRGHGEGERRERKRTDGPAAPKLKLKKAKAEKRNAHEFLGVCQMCRRNTVVSKKYFSVFLSPLCRLCNFKGQFEIAYLAKGLAAVVGMHQAR